MVNIKVFEERKVCTVWDDKEEKWYFSIVDVVAVLTDSADPKQYIKRMKSRDESLKANWGTICTLVPLESKTGKSAISSEKSLRLSVAARRDW